MAHTKPDIMKVSCMQPVFEHYVLAVTLSCVRKLGTLPLLFLIHTLFRIEVWYRAIAFAHLV